MSRYPIKVIYGLPLMRPPSVSCLCTKEPANIHLIELFMRRALSTHQIQIKILVKTIKRHYHRSGARSQDWLAGILNAHSGSNNNIPRFHWDSAHGSTLAGNSWADSMSKWWPATGSRKWQRWRRQGPSAWQSMVQRQLAVTESPGFCLFIVFILNLNWPTTQNCWILIIIFLISVG